MVKDLNVNRRELSDWENGLAWSREGTLILGTTPEITLGQPIYRRQVERNARNMFQLRSYELSVEENAFEFVQPGQNAMLNSDPASKIRVSKPSNVHNLLACLTTNGNCIVFEDQNLSTNITPIEGSVEQRTIHSVCWSPDDRYICLGNECGQLIVYTVEKQMDNRFTFTTPQVITTTSSGGQWVTDILWDMNHSIIFSLLDNSVYKTEGFDEVKEVKQSSRFKINDMKLVRNHLLVSSTGILECINLSSMKTVTETFSNYEAFHIIPLYHQTAEDEVSAILISNKSSIRVTVKEDVINVMEDDVVSPHLEKKFKKWCTLFNEYNRYEVSLFIYGISLSPDGYSVAILFSIDRISLKYRIVSENKLYITFIPLYDQWDLSKAAIGLAWYQTYNIYDCKLPKNIPATIENDIDHLDKSLPFKEYLAHLMERETIIKMQFSNFIEERSDISYIFKAIYEYCESNKDKITNELDKACINTISTILGHEPLVEEVPFIIKGDHIEENFTAQEVKDIETILSVENHAWKRCAITFLPLLSTKLKICPVTGKRIIDISSDNHNEFGWLTKSLLETFSVNSPYSGTPLTSSY